MEEWPDLTVNGRGDFILYEKLKRLKSHLREWNREIFGWIDLKVNKEVGYINDLDNMLVDNIGGDIEALVQSRRDISKELWNCLNVKECMLRLKSIQLWLKEGDRNSIFFHNFLKERQRRNAITSLEGEYGLVDGVDNIKEEITYYFHASFKEDNFTKPTPESLGFSCLSESDFGWLERPFTEEEVKDVVWSCDGNKSPSSDGYTLDFFKCNWEVIKDDVSRFVMDFHEKARLTKACTSSFITLISKVKNL